MPVKNVIFYNKITISSEYDSTLPFLNSKSHEIISQIKILCFQKLKRSRKEIESIIQTKQDTKNRAFAHQGSSEYK